jgi:hypothetical protein
VLINNFPQHFLDEHTNWHHSHHPTASAGYGNDFLYYHRDFISRVRNDLINNLNFDPTLLAAWNEIPTILKTELNAQNNPRWGWNPTLAADEAQVLNRPYTFYTSDALGLLLDRQNPGGLHGWMHRNAGFKFGDAQGVEGGIFRDFETSPRSTLFYNWHGLIDAWLRRWETENSAWPRTIDWLQLSAGVPLADGDVITATIAPNALAPQLPEDAVDFALSSTLPWWKEMNVPDGETGSSWDIWTGYNWLTGQRSTDSVALWAHQVLNGQMLWFGKAKTFGMLSWTYRLGHLEVLPPRSRVTFTWVSE